MADYNPIADTETDVGAGLTSSLMKRIVANMLAMFEGASGAPRVNWKAIYTSVMGRAAVSDTSPVQWLNLDGVGEICIQVSTNTPGGSAVIGVEMSYSANNGATWGSWQTLNASYGGTNFNTQGAEVIIWLPTGALSTMPMTAGGTISYQTHTVPANCNAVRIRRIMSSGSGGTMAVRAYKMGGRG